MTDPMVAELKLELTGAVTYPESRPSEPAQPVDASPSADDTPCSCCTEENEEQDA